MAQFGLGYGDANTVALFVGKPVPDLGAGPSAQPEPAATAGDPLDEIYAGARAGLRPLHHAVMAAVQGFGAFEVAPKKGYVSLRRKKQFAMVGPATKTQIEIGLNAKGLSGSARLKAMPAGGMCPFTLRLSSTDEIDGELKRWLRTAYDSAG